MTEAATTATATLGVDGAAVLELDESGESLTMVAGVDIPEGFAGAEIPLGEAANAGYTVRVGEPMVVEDMATETRFDRRFDAAQARRRQQPQRPDRGPATRPFGVLNVHAREPRRFSEDEVEFLTAIATLIIVAVERDARSRRRDTPRCTIRSPACRTARSRSTGSRTRWPAGDASASTWRSSCSTSTASSSSTTRSVTPPATRCCSRWRPG